MNESNKLYAEQKQKDYIVYDFIYMKLEKENLIYSDKKQESCCLVLGMCAKRTGWEQTQESFRNNVSVLFVDCDVTQVYTSVKTHHTKHIKQMHFMYINYYLESILVSCVINILKCKIYNIDMFSIKPKFCGRMSLYITVNSFSSNYFFKTLNMT